MRARTPSAPLSRARTLLHRRFSRTHCTCLHFFCTPFHPTRTPRRQLPTYLSTLPLFDRIRTWFVPPRIFFILFSSVCLPLPGQLMPYTHTYTMHENLPKMPKRHDSVMVDLAWFFIGGRKSYPPRIHPPTFLHLSV